MSNHAHRSRRRPRRRAALGASAVAVVLAGGGAVVLATGANAASVGAVYSTTSDWGSGYSGQYDVSNPTAGTISNWTLSFDLPAGAHISSLWNATYTASGQHIKVTPASWDSTLASNQHAVVGFVVQGSGAPVNCNINGADCSTGAAPTPSGQPTTSKPTPAPTPSKTPSPTPTPSKTPAPTPTPTPTSTGSASGAGFSPYIDTSLYPAYDMIATAKATGVKNFNLAFIVDGGGCTPKWGGVTGLTNDGVPGQIGALRALGGDVRVSFGGANGTELADSCTSVSALTAAYQQAIDAYGLTKIDFDVEGAAASDTAGIARRDQAIAQLQATARGKGKTLDVSFTLPVLPSGLVQAGTDLLQNAKSAGVSVSAVNVMAMDFGDGAAPSPSGKMGQYAIDAATATQAQVKSIFGWDDATAWKHVAVTPMIGVNDTSSEVFGVSDASQLAQFASGKHLGWLSMWSATRDAQCSGGAKSYADATCSSIVQSPLAFTKAFGVYAG